MDTDTNDQIDDEIFEGGEPAEISPDETPEVEAAPTAQAETEGGEPGQPVDPQPTNEGMMPYGAYQSEKTKRQEAEKALAEREAAFKQMEARMAVMERMQQQQPRDERPVDPAEQLASVESKMTLRLSEFEAAQEFGKDVVKEATEAAFAAMQTQPHLAQRMAAAANPHAEAVKWHREQQTLSQMTPERLKAFQEWEAAQVGSAPQQPAAQPAAITQTPATPQPVIPPNNAARTSAAAAATTPTFEDVESDLWGNR